MEIIRKAWDDKPFSFKGELFDYDNLDVLAKPVQRPHPPIWVGASRSAGTFRWAGEQDAWSETFLAALQAYVVAQRV